jgi:hypothetical protein
VNQRYQTELLRPRKHGLSCEHAGQSLVQAFLDTEEVRGSNPQAPTKEASVTGAFFISGISASLPCEWQTTWKTCPSHLQSCKDSGPFHHRAADGSSCAPHRPRRDPPAHSRSGSRTALDNERPSDRLDAIGHALEPGAALSGVRIEASTVVGDF